MTDWPHSVSKVIDVERFPEICDRWHGYRRAAYRPKLLNTVRDDERLCPVCMTIYRELAAQHQREQS